MELRQKIDELADATPQTLDRQEAIAILDDFLGALESGEIRAASPESNGRWVVHDWVKRGLLLCFRWGEIADFSINDLFQYRDKDTLPPQDIRTRENPPRIVPGGTTIRRGAYLGKQVIVVPPSYINVGAWVGDGTMVDSHVLVGSCAQIGGGVHLSAGVQIGGVMEPIGSLPVIVEDEVFVGAQCAILEGAIVRKGAVLGAGVILTRATRVYDLARSRILQPGNGGALEIPENAVVVPGARPARGEFARDHGVMLQTPVIVRYREPDEPPALALEKELR